MDEPFAIHCTDCVTGLREHVEPESIDLTVTSIPFGALFSYSGKTEDIGNSRDGTKFVDTYFGLHLRFFAEALLEAQRPGTNACIHIQQLVSYRIQHGYMGRRDFRGAVVDVMEAAGWEWRGEVAIPKNPQVIAQRQNLHSLMFVTGRRNALDLAPAVNDYLMIFQRPGEAPPVRALQGEDNPDGWVTTEQWIRWASGVWDDIRETDVLEGWQDGRDADDEKHVCLARGSRVLTRERGYVAIETVELGEHVLTHMGRWRPVLAVQSTGERPAVTVRAQGVPGLTLTPDHKLWMRKGPGAHVRAGATRAAPDWIAASESLLGYVNLKLPEAELPREENVDLWWAVGRWLADGHWDSRDAVHISCGDHELADLTRSLGARAGTIRHTGTSCQVRLRDRGDALRAILRRCGRGAEGKQLPPEAFTLPAPQASALLDGYLSGDGHFREDRRRWMATSISRDLLLGVAMLAQRAHGAIACVYAGRGPRDSEIDGRAVRCRQEWVLSFDLPGGRRKRAFVLDDGAWKRVRSIEYAGVVETWNLRVAEDESYTAEGCVVKNCPLQLEVIRRPVLLYTRPGALVCDPFMGIGSTAHVALEHGRRVVGFELKESYHRQAVRNAGRALAGGGPADQLDMLEAASA